MGIKQKMKKSQAVISNLNTLLQRAETLMFISFGIYILHITKYLFPYSKVAEVQHFNGLEY